MNNSRHLRARHAAIFAELVLFAAVHASAQATTQTNPPPAAQSNPKTIEVDVSSVIQMKDDAGRTVGVRRPLRRIVSLAPSVTETLFALGAAERLVGDTDYCDYPPEAQKKTKVGGVINPNIEQIVALKPDLVVVAATNRWQTVDALDHLNVATYATDAHDVQSVLASVARLADAIGSSDDGKALVASLQARLDDLHRRLAGVTSSRVLFVVWQEPLISVGRDTFLADALRWAGAESIITVKQDWPHISLEEVVRLQPDYLVFASAHSEEELTSLTALRTAPVWRDLKAVQENHIVVISDAVNRPAPRLIDAIEELARLLHPAAFVDAPHPAPAPPKGSAR